LQDEIKNRQERIGSLQQELEKSKAERQAVNARYDAEKSRYKELTGK
jgi:uncharacterized small protein (DUF1192 family)